MALSAKERRCVGLDDSALRRFEGGLLGADTLCALRRLQEAARSRGFELQVASAYRSLERQRQIWNRKLSGERPVLDDEDREVDLAALPPWERIERVLRFSALPGASRHHWGTEIDVFDAAALAPGERVALNLAEVAPGGRFDALHCWLDERIATGQSFGFYRPYDRDRGGVSPERWHLSYAPDASEMAAAFTARGLVLAWDTLEREAKNAEALRAVVRPREDARRESEALALREVLESRLDELIERYVLRVADPPPAALTYRV